MLLSGDTALDSPQSTLFECILMTSCHSVTLVSYSVLSLTQSCLSLSLVSHSVLSLTHYCLLPLGVNEETLEDPDEIVRDTLSDIDR
jgi:hypothetical protein